MAVFQGPCCSLGFPLETPTKGTLQKEVPPKNTRKGSLQKERHHPHEESLKGLAGPRLVCRVPAAQPWRGCMCGQGRRGRPACVSSEWGVQIPSGGCGFGLGEPRLQSFITSKLHARGKVCSFSRVWFGAGWRFGPTTRASNPDPPIQTTNCGQLR